MTDNHFRLSTLQEALIGIKNEKVVLIERLAKLKQKRECLSKDLYQAESRYCDLENDHEKMQETMKRTKFKVQEMQGQISSLKEPHQKLKKDIQELDVTLKNEEGKRCQNQKVFEKDLNLISQQFTENKNVHDSQNLRKEREELIQRTNNINLSANEKKKDIGLLNAEINELGNGKTESVSSELHNLYYIVLEEGKGINEKITAIEDINEG